MKTVPCECHRQSTFSQLFRYRWQILSPGFSRDAFLSAITGLVKFPERSSSGILRADIFAEESAKSTLPGSEVTMSINEKEWSLTKRVSRRILPRNPRIDGSMEQHCYFFLPIAGESDEMLVIFEPEDKLHIPFYHPQVSAIAFHYSCNAVRIAYSLGATTIGDVFGQSVPLENRLERTLLQLITIVAKHSKGFMNNYQKRVDHDLVVPKNDWQDLYTDLKGRLAAEYVTNWVESTDPRKHVFEDLGIASFLINLGRQINDVRDSAEQITYVDLGCGNGLLVEILLREGLEIYGFDARHRKSWSTYRPETQAALLEQILYPSILRAPELSADPALEMASIALNYGQFSSSQFLIGNHADELTPYIPLLAAIASSSDEERSTAAIVNTAGFVIIPCCMHTFSGEKHNGLSSLGGRYASYVTWLTSICEEVGWIVEREALRIPSTRNIALIGRRRRLVENVAVSSTRTSSAEGQLQPPVAGNRERLTELCRSIVERNGGMGNFLARARSLTSNKPRAH